MVALLRAGSRVGGRSTPVPDVKGAAPATASACKGAARSRVSCLADRVVANADWQRCYSTRTRKHSVTKAPDDQPMLMRLPEIIPDVPGSKDAEDIAPTTMPAATPLAALAIMFEIFPGQVPGVFLIDPRAVAVDPINARHGLPFDPDTRGELIASMRTLGNSVPVRLRRDPEGGPGFLCVSGAQRLGAALHIQKEDPGFRLRALIAETMSDAEAFEIGEADNVGRTDITPMQQARKWQEALVQVYAGDRQTLIRATGRSASVVSRTLALLMLPDYVFATCSDVEGLNPYFAEQVMPRVGDPAEEPHIRRRAEALMNAGRRLPGAKLASALLADAKPRPQPARMLWEGGGGRARVLIKQDDRDGATVRLTGTADLDRAERRALVKAFAALVEDMTKTGSPQKEPTSGSHT